MLRCGVVWNVVLCGDVRCVVVVVLRNGVCPCGLLCSVGIGVGFVLGCALLNGLLCCGLFLWCCVFCCMDMRILVLWRGVLCFVLWCCVACCVVVFCVALSLFARRCVCESDV